MYIVAAQIIRKDDPTSLILFSGISNTHDTLHNMDCADYYDYIFSLNASKTLPIYDQLDFDVVNIHPYCIDERDFEQVILDVEAVCEKWGFDASIRETDLDYRIRLGHISG